MQITPLIYRIPYQSAIILLHFLQKTPFKQHNQVTTSSNSGLVTNIIIYQLGKSTLPEYFWIVKFINQLKQLL